MTTIKLSPSALTFLYDECKRCFYLSLMRGFRRPSVPFPKIFSKIDVAMKDLFMDGPNREIHADLPSGRMIMAQHWVESSPLTLPNHTLQPYFKGLFDAVLQFDEGGYGLIDFKTSEYNPAQLPFYSRQLSSYVYALEHPSPTGLSLEPITRMGLVYFTPDHFVREDEEQISLHGKAHWKEIVRNDEDFLHFIDEVLSVLELPEPPEPDPDCVFCKYRAEAAENRF